MKYLLGTLIFLRSISCWADAKQDFEIARIKFETAKATENTKLLANRARTSAIANGMNPQDYQITINLPDAYLSSSNEACKLVPGVANKGGQYISWNEDDPAKDSFECYKK